MMNPEKLNKIIHERVRLAVMSALAARGKLTFPELKELLEVTDGNLSVHSRILEEHGLISVKKDYAGRKPRTTFSITAEGRKQFNKYIEDLENMLEQ
ncbi:MAG: winged helix-turn-helix domain-containing protein [Planctomycetota bacterium]|jgi:DNA-binding MarR family transcriptional regulator